MTPFDRAQRFIGLAEITGADHHPLIQWWLSLCGMGNNSSDETPWCSAFVNGICWDLRLPRSKSAAARSWLAVGSAVTLADARPGYDVVILMRGEGKQPGPDVLNAPGHVGLYAGVDSASTILVLGGNQANQVSVTPYLRARLLGIRRLAAPT